MLTMPRWKIITILSVALLGILYSMPNLAGPAARDWMHQNLPSWMPGRTVNLGLDLRGGAHLLYEVDVDGVFRERGDLMVQDLRAELRDAKIGYKRIGSVANGALVTLREAGDADAVRKIIRKLDPNIDVETASDGVTIEASMNEAGMKAIYDQTISQSIENVRRRVDELGTTEPLIQRQGDNRILIQAPGANAEQLKSIIGTTAKLGFHLVPESPDAGTKSFPFAEEPGRRIAVARRPMITGEMLETAQPSSDQFGRTVISFRMNNTGARRFCDVTRQNVHKPFAIVLDNEVLSAPVIQEPICGGQGQISGNFTIQSASKLALLLRAGALPAPMKVVEERTVGPTLGSDSVKAGRKACLVGLALVVVMACLVYGLFGIFASLGLFINLALILAVMSSLQATLTLPGIAGIVLTIGLAIDGNVLVFERIKEELRAGRSIMSAIDTGYSRARTTITDSNLTALIAAMILFSFGTGPIKGFAVTMCIGVATSYFCALSLTRLMVLMWLKWKKPKVIPV
ncbi:MAG: protein translocase subunit SecD [Alphaproteobacteria bacterium]